MRSIFSFLAHGENVYMENPNHPRQQLSLYYGPFDQENSWIKKEGKTSLHRWWKIKQSGHKDYSVLTCTVAQKSLKEILPLYLILMR